MEILTESINNQSYSLVSSLNTSDSPIISSVHKVAQNSLPHQYNQTLKNVLLITLYFQRTSKEGILDMRLRPQGKREAPLSDVSFKLVLEKFRHSRDVHIEKKKHNGLST